MKLLLFWLLLVLSLSSSSEDACDPSKVSNLTSHEPSLLRESERDSLIALVKEHFGEETVKAALENPDGEEMRRIYAFIQGQIIRTTDRRMLVGNAIGRFIDFTMPFRHTFVPHRRLLERGSLRIVGRRSTNLETTEGVAKAIEGFDERARAWGLRIPGLTKILLIEETALARFGSSALPTPVFDFPRRRLARSIELAPAFHDNTSAYLDPRTLMHERAHDLLMSNFKRRSYVNTDKVLKEALADFLAAHASGNPQGTYRHIKEMRDENGTFINEENLDGLGYHAQSIVLSNLLWNLREKIGEQGMSEMLVSFIGRLNAYGEPVGMEDDFVSGFEYFAAVLLRTAREEGYGDGAASVIGESVRKFSIDEKRIVSLSEELGGTDTMWTENLVTVGDAAYGYGVTLAPWLMCGSWISLFVWLLSWIFL